MPRLSAVMMTVLVLLALPKEAYMSQVTHESVEMPLRECVEALSESDHVLVVKGPIASEQFLEVIFPKETQFQKGGPTTYFEHVFQYQVMEVIKSDFFKNGDRFWVWKEPNYDFTSTRLYHEEGFSESPIILTRKSQYPVEGKEKIVAARKLEGKIEEMEIMREKFRTLSFVINEEIVEMFSFEFEEGLGAEEEIRQLLKAKEMEERRRRKRWWQIWK